MVKFNSIAFAGTTRAVHSASIQHYICPNANCRGASGKYDLCLSCARFKTTDPSSPPEHIEIVQRLLEMGYVGKAIYHAWNVVENPTIQRLINFLLSNPDPPRHFNPQSHPPRPPPPPPPKRTAAPKSGTCVVEINGEKIHLTEEDLNGGRKNL